MRIYWRQNNDSMPNFPFWTCFCYDDWLTVCVWRSLTKQTKKKRKEIFYWNVNSAASAVFRLLLLCIIQQKYKTKQKQQPKKYCFFSPIWDYRFFLAYCVCARSALHRSNWFINCRICASMTAQFLQFGSSHWRYCWWLNVYITSAAAAAHTNHWICVRVRCTFINLRTVFASLISFANTANIVIYLYNII